jgi:hypothetical protein
VDLRNDTPFGFALTLGMGPDRAPHLGVVVKATLRIPETLDAPVTVAEEQVPVEAADDFYEGDVTASLLSDGETYVYKPRADVLLLGSAHAPGGRSVPALDVALRVGRHEWALRVTGDRQWLFPSRAVLVPMASDPQPFTRVPLRYERSYGGFDHRGRAWCAENPIGRGFIGRKTRESVHETFLPNVEHPRHPIRSWDDRPPVAGWGPVRKDWAPRSRLSGRNIDALHETFGLPADFDHAYYNAAHPDLQVPFLNGDEPVELQHLTPDGYRRFRLPGLAPVATLGLFTDGRTWDDVLAEPLEAPPVRPTRDEPLPLRLDTLVLRPDDGVLHLLWRGSRAVPDLALEGVAGIHLTASPTAR